MRLGNRKQMLKYLTIVFPLLWLAFSTCYAQRVKNETAIFSGLDKITGRTISFKVKVNDKYQFGTLELSPKACYTSVGDDPRGATVFVTITENQRNNVPKRIFNGWMFAESPALNGMDHPIYDIWPTGCEQPH